ncbi:hypothetical protein PCASD_01902 [Puccinia coronata f. sp. avenae]|uniref:mannan endo-1,6-alpha-mannosidase n=1 Tax=Puccinia coronata f. sp. avenae TaxID=200324 RepID=A0A2N5VJU2_9BASI|nr:hypothetical protein PCASD_01902 [Puccinia coronata f. sp. avenae]
MRGANVIILVSLLSMTAATVSDQPQVPSLDLHDFQQLKQAARAAMGNLMSYFIPNSRGSFNETLTPWHESGMIWGMHFDYARWTGDTQYLDTVTRALFNQSNGARHNFLAPGAKEQWNDDILWPNQAVVAAAEFYGRDSTLPNSNETWINLADKTYQQAGSQRDDKCGGGIYWYRDRADPRGSYKSSITHFEFISQGARNYLITKDPQTLHQAKHILDWVISSGLANPRTGLLMDGVSSKNCTDFITFQWSYNYGQLLGSLAWMHRATGDQRFLDMAAPYLDYSARTFASSNTSGVIAELCETTSCSRDQQGFKAVYARNLAYLHQETTNITMKQTIEKVIDTSVQAMASHSCDSNWNCAAIWSAKNHLTTELPPNIITTPFMTTNQ